MKKDGMWEGYDCTIATTTHAFCMRAKGMVAKVTVYERMQLLKLSLIRYVPKIFHTCWSQFLQRQKKKNTFEHRTPFENT